MSPRTTKVSVFSRCPIPTTAAEAIASREELDAALRLDDEQLSKFTSQISAKEREQQAFEAASTLARPISDIQKILPHRPLVISFFARRRCDRDESRNAAKRQTQTVI